MQQNKQENEIDLRALFDSVVARRFLIAGLTVFVTILAILYTNTLVQTYQATSSFKPTSKSSILDINNLTYTSVTNEMIFSDFLDLISSRELQKRVFIENDFLTIFNKDNKPIDNVDSFIDSIIIEPLAPLNNKIKDPYLTENRYIVSMKGANADAMSQYLDALVASADSKNIMELLNLNKQNISIRLDQILKERGLLLVLAEKDRLSKIKRIKEEDGQKIRQINDQIEALKLKAKKDRLNQIKRIKEEDGQKIRQINDQIDRARYEAKENRLNQMMVLNESIKLAKSLGIIENNFKLINDDWAKSDFTIAISESKDLPEWYLYGEKALIQRVELLENRISDDPFIPELVTLKNQLNEVQNNNILKTLETRQDDTPFIPEIVALQNTLKEVQLNNALKTLELRQDDIPFVAQINKLDTEKIKIESINHNLASSSSSITSLETARVKNTPSNKRSIILLAFIGSFIMSILLALIMGALKPDEKTPN